MGWLLKPAQAEMGYPVSVAGLEQACRSAVTIARSDQHMPCTRHPGVLESTERCPRELSGPAAGVSGHQHRAAHNTSALPWVDLCRDAAALASNSLYAEMRWQRLTFWWTHWLLGASPWRMV